MFTGETYEMHTTSWSDLRRLLKKYWFLVLITFASGTIATYLTLQLFFTNQYESKASLLVKVGRENTELPATVLNGQVLNQGVRLQDINSEVQMLSSRVLVEKVVDEMGPERFKFELKKPESIFGYPKYAVKRVARWVKKGYKEFLILANIKKRLSPREQAIVGLAEGITVEPFKESDVLQLKVRLPDPGLCVEVANRVLAHYMEERSKARRAPAGSGFFQSELAENRARMNALLEARATLRGKWGLSSAEQQRGLLLQQLSAVRSQAMQQNSEIVLLEKQRAEMATQLTTAPQMLRKEQVEARNPALQSMKDRLASLQVERAKIASRYQPDSQMVKRVEEEIAELETAMSKEPSTVASSSTSEVNPVVREFTDSMAQSTVRIAGLTSSNMKLSEASRAIERELQKLNEAADAYETLDRDYKIAERNYLEYAKKEEDARISEELDARQMPNVALMAAPELPIEPVYPRHLFILAFALPISLLLGIALAALWETMDDRIHDTSSLEKLGFSVLGSWSPVTPATGAVHGD